MLVGATKNLSIFSSWLKQCSMFIFVGSRSWMNSLNDLGVNHGVIGVIMV